MKIKKQTKQGISLIVLVITIIVMIILAATVIISLTNNGIIGKANEAVEKTNLAQVKTMASAIWSEVYLENREKAEGAKLDYETEVTNRLAAQKIDVNRYVIQADESGVTVKEKSEVYLTTLPDGAYYMNANTGAFYSEMPTTVSNGDVFLYGDYIYIYNTQYSSSGWMVMLATSDFEMGGMKIADALPDYELASKTQTEYETVLNGIADKPITALYGTYYGCTNLKVAPEVPNSVTDMSGTFLDCINLEVAPKIPSGVTNMTGTFNGCKKLEVAPIIPSGVTNMTGTFELCSKLKVAPEIPNSVTDMSSAFRCCTSLTTVSTISNSVTLMVETFSGCTNLTTLPTIPGSVTDMSGAFSDCTSLTTTPRISNGVTDMSYAFMGCKSLTTVTEIPSSVTDMSQTFSDCTNLTTVPSIPSGVMDMTDTFSYCSSLTGTITINANPEQWTACLYGTQITEVAGDTTMKSQFMATKTNNAQNPTE